MQGKDSKERDCLSFEGFCRCIRIDISHRLEHAEVTVQEVLKPNDVKLHGLTIRKKGGSNICPAIYLEAFYDEYLHGKSLDGIEQIILSVYQRDKAKATFDTESFKDWEWARERIVFRLVSMGRNRELLEEVPYVPYLDLAATFHCLVDVPGLGGASIAVHNSHMEMWGTTADGLYAAAVENTPRLLPPVIHSMAEVLEELMGGTCGQDMPADKAMYVLSNRNRNNGAACLLYQGVLQGLADLVGADLYILPKNVHGVILMPAEGGTDPAGLDRIVREVNDREVHPQEILSDHVYRYIRETGEVTYNAGGDGL